jgi:hypothetical protein
MSIRTIITRPLGAIKSHATIRVNKQGAASRMLEIGFARSLRHGPGNEL